MTKTGWWNENNHLDAIAYVMCVYDNNSLLLNDMCKQTTFLNIIWK